MSGTRHFGCTRCGRCCNRSPEVELSEAAPLAGTFIFRLMFRLYRLPRQPERGEPGGTQLFYEKKRLLEAHAAHRYASKTRSTGRSAERINYLMISALAMDGSRGSCAALGEGSCTIHERRPLGCRSVPLHYSRPPALAKRDFDLFVNTPEHRCDTSKAAPLFLEDGRILDAATLEARAEALALARRDRGWKQAIVRRMKKGCLAGALPSLGDVEACASCAALTTSMKIGWEIAADEGLLSAGRCRDLFAQQLATIEREARAGTMLSEKETLAAMRADYGEALGDDPARVSILAREPR